MAVVKCVAFKDDVFMRLMEFRRKTGKSFSFAVNFYVMQGIKAEEQEQQPKIVKCPVCGAEYSSKLGYCPQCAERELEAIKRREEELKHERQRLEEIEQLRDKIYMLRRELDTVEKAKERVVNECREEGKNYEEDERYKKLVERADSITSEIKQIEERIEQLKNKPRDNNRNL